MKNIFLILLLISNAVFAAPPTKVVNEKQYKVGEIDVVTLTINGGAPFSCTITPNATDSTYTDQTCSIVGKLPTPGLYTFIMTVTRNESLITTPGVSASYVPAGSASSAPFTYTLGDSVIGSPSNETMK